MCWPFNIFSHLKLLISGAIDNDKPKEILTYTITGCWWGNVTLRKNPDYSVQTFTQDDIDEGSVMFKHTSKCSNICELNINYPKILLFVFLQTGPKQNFYLLLAMVCM